MEVKILMKFLHIFDSFKSHMVKYCPNVNINKKFEFWGKILFMYIFLIRIYLKNEFWQELKKSESLWTRKVFEQGKTVTVSIVLMNNTEQQ
jgi:hypothetical protein